MTQEHIENVVVFHFKPGERARIKKDRYQRSGKTPPWADRYCCTVIRNNSLSVTVRIDGYENETHYVDELDLVPLE